jgi:hypothetical protein
MARNATLLKLLNDVRAEARLSLDPGLNVQTRDSHVNLIQREQERLWEDFAWPHLRVQRFLPVSAGQRYYDLDSAETEAGATPAQQIAVDRVETIEVKSDGQWLPLEPGISISDYAAFDSALDERSWPPRRWKISEDEQIEIWPLPDESAGVDQYGLLRITGIRNLRPLVDDSDRADLDDRLIALYVAGGILAGKKADDANLKLETANRHYGKLRGSLSKSPTFNMFNTTARPTRTRPYISRYKPPVAY